MTLVKQPATDLTYELQFAALGSGESIQSVDRVDIAARGLVAEVAPLTIAEQGSAGRSLYLRLAGGTDGETYLITAVVTDTAGEIQEADVEVMVLDLAWTVPDAPQGATTYIQPADYVARFGVAEAVRLTDELLVGRVDRKALFAALADAAAEIDSYLGGRYAVPLSPVPASVITIAADLTRARLHTTGMPEHVERNADRARRQLKDLATGLAKLPGTAPKTQGQDTPLYDAPQRLFTRDSLKGF